MIYLGICLWIWLLVGFMVGVKKIYVDKKLSEENLNIMLLKANGDEIKELVYRIMSKKTGFLAVASLLGIAAFIMDTIGTFSKEGDSQ